MSEEVIKHLGGLTRTFSVAIERGVDDPRRFHWLLVPSDTGIPHSRSSLSYPTEEAARSEAEALARVLNAAITPAPRRRVWSRGSTSQ